MKFKKLDLDESLFDVPQVSSQSLTAPFGLSYDDDFSAPDYMPNMEGVTNGPQEGSDTGIADLLIDAINDEWNTIRKYNSLVATLRVELANNSSYSSFITIIEDITAEENKHVGQLQEALRVISPNAQLIEKGREEGRSQFNFANGQLQVQAWDTSSPQSVVSDVCTGNEPCSLLNVDDEM